MSEALLRANALLVIECVDEFGIDAVADFLIKIYSSGRIPTHLIKSMFLYFQRNQLQLNVNYTVRLVSCHVAKELLKTIMATMRNIIKSVIADEQSVFVRRRRYK